MSETVHLKFGGSSAARTIQCPGWLSQVALLPPADSSSYAMEGKALHHVMELMLTADEPVSPYDFVGYEYHEAMEEPVVITMTHVEDKVIPAWEAWEEICKLFSVEEYEIETFVRFSGDTGGTIDVLAKTRHGKLLVIDFKFGDGVLVSVEENAQLMFYDMCAATDPDLADWLADVTEHVLIVIQPTARQEGVWHSWVASDTARAAFAVAYGHARDAAKEATEHDHHLLRAGPYCQFCPAQPTCPAKTGLLDRMRRMEPAQLTDLGAALHFADEIESWIAAVRQLAHQQMERGDKVPGFKLVHKRATRQWNDRPAVEDFVKRSRKLKADDAYKHELLSPAQLEKLCKKHGVDFKQLEQYVSAVSSGTTIASASDPRPEAPSLTGLKALAGRLAS